MDRKDLVNAIEDLTEALRMLDYCLGNDATPTTIGIRRKLVKRNMRVLDHAMEDLRAELDTPPSAQEGE